MEALLQLIGIDKAFPGVKALSAILIVEFAEAAVAEGYSLSRAALRAAQTRLRPIIMTSLAFIAGVMPLAMATGAGANSRIAIGTGIWIYNWLNPRTRQQAGQKVALYRRRRLVTH